ncbi:hypothetical protein FFI89_016955 [Bradyrhizobium sp. KBS0727]|uniref:hypothetical protein n=1 Tax=unclassified Bradyrhizobium TaxID=2631580 RepID=UPI00110F46FF|nr:MULTISPECIES: hypothetical protein [unclassified Bradyrhizobium]QDW38687.1 hypothetical protein FFI71_016950 [Bradyrhizobium sp. KBS0725]QDW45291.1 hypothetical protein FFI89_016955 [Bradyrhizobium sp. KBS0727]
MKRCPGGAAFCRFAGRAMSEFRPTPHQHLAVEAKLNMLLGAATYDRLLIGFEVVSVKDGVLLVLVDPDKLPAISHSYSIHLAVAVESVLKRAVKSVALKPRPER